MEDYDDILYLPHPLSAKHPRMSIHDRAAQFSPFAALTGYEDAIEETGRLTDCRSELDDYGRDILDRKQRYLMEHLPEHPNITITRFIPDAYKMGGTYSSISGKIKKIDAHYRWIILMDGAKIFLDDIVDIEFDIPKDGRWME